MASKENAELDPTNTGTGDEAIAAARKKRLRRVSFADVEITSVHIFKRDEDYSDSTPPFDPNPSGGTGKQVRGDGLGLFRDLGDNSDDSKELIRNGEGEEDDDGDEEEVGRGSFFRPVESSSPGSSTAGSAISNDEDNFFGPVSTSFIRPGRLSDSATSDENHEITMDSTAFSMHFQSLARSEPGDLRTPSRVGLGFEEKTPTQDARDTDQGSLMVLTNARKSTPESSLPPDHFRSGGKDSNEMSLVGENPHRYDYGRLSPSQDVLLAEGNEDLQRVSLLTLADLKPSSRFDADESIQMDLLWFGDGEIDSCTPDINKLISEAHAEVQHPNSCSKIMPTEQVMKDVSNRNDWFANASENTSTNTPEHLVKVDKLNEPKVLVKELNSGFSSITRCPPHKNLSGVLDLDDSALHGSAHVESSNEYAKENFPGNESLPVVKSGGMTGTPLTGSITSIYAKRREIFSCAATSPATFASLTPLLAQAASSSSKDSAKHGLNLSSIQKRILKFKTQDISPTASAVKNGIGMLKLEISNYLSANSPHYTARVVSTTDAPGKVAHTPLAHLKQLNGDPKEVDYGSMPPVDNNGILSPRETEMVCVLGENREVALVMKPGGPHDDRYTSNSCNNELAPEVSSPLIDVALDQRTNDRDPCVPTEKYANQKSPTAQSYQKGVTVELNHQHQLNELADVNSEENQCSKGVATPSGYLTPNPEKLRSYSLLKDSNQKSSAVKYYPAVSSVELNQKLQLKNLTAANREESQISSGIVISNGCSTPNPQKLQSFSSSLIAEDEENLDILPPSTHKGLPRVNNGSDLNQDVRDTSAIPTPVSSHGRTEESPFNKSRLEKLEESPRRTKSTRSPVVRELLNSIPADDVQCLHKEDHFISTVDCQESYHSASPFHLDGCDESSSRKRSREEAVDGDEYHMSKISRANRSLEMENSDNHNTACDSEPANEREKLGLDMQPRDWKEVLKQFSQDTEEMLNSSVVQLDLRGITMFGEMLNHHQKVRKYNTLSSEIQSQVWNRVHNRSAEIMLLLQKLVYEKARLQLNLVQRDRLKEMAQSLSSGIKESQKLRQVYGELVSPPAEIRNQLDRDCSICLSKSKLRKDAHDSVTSMRQECEVLDEQMQSLRNSLLAYCKMKGERNCTRDMASIDNVLKKRMYCRLIHQHLQPWEVADFESSNGHHNISLNYLGFIHQSVSVTAYPVRGVTISNKLQDTKIEKTFPNTDACTAFTYVFKEEAIKKMAIPGSLAQKTQMTHSLLRNLLEVVEEVQQARLEIANLISTSFLSPSGERLHLLLSFINLKSYQKVTVTLDMTCLRRGIYPSEVMPTVTSETPQSLAMEIGEAARCLPFGYQRIMRLCGCISRLVQSSSG